VTIDDRFDGPALNRAIWNSLGEGGGWTMGQRGGQLELSFQSGATPDPHTGDYGVHLTTQCTFPGDFDARVDYKLAQWPADNGVSMLLSVLAGPTPTVWSSQPGPDTTGTLRVVRHNGVITTSYLRQGSWVTVSSGKSTEPASISLSATGSQALSAPVVVDFDNFRLTAAHPACPGGN
jgi:hypothetical protein